MASNSPQPSPSAFRVDKLSTRHHGRRTGRSAFRGKNMQPNSLTDCLWVKTERGGGSHLLEDRHEGIDGVHMRVVRRVHHGRAVRLRAFLSDGDSVSDDWCLENGPLRRSPTRDIGVTGRGLSHWCLQRRLTKEFRPDDPWLLQLCKRHKPAARTMRRVTMGWNFKPHLCPSAHNWDQRKTKSCGLASV